MSKLIERFKEWLYWIKRPNDLYQVNCEDEKTELRQWIKTDESKQVLAKQYDEFVKELNNL